MTAGLIFRRFFLTLAYLDEKGEIPKTNVPERFSDYSLRELSNVIRYDSLMKIIDRGAKPERLPGLLKEMKILKIKGPLP